MPDRPPRTDPEGSPGGVLPEDLDRLPDRLSIDREGRWRHDGRIVTHPGTVRMLFRHLRREGGRLVVRVGRAWAAVRVEDTPYVVREVVLPGDAGAADDADGADDPVEVVLQDGSRERLDPTTVTIGDDDVLYTRVRGGTEEARFLRGPHYRLAAARIERTPRGWVLRVGNAAHRLRAR